MDKYSQSPRLSSTNIRETFASAMKAAIQPSEVQNEFFRKSSKRRMSPYGRENGAPPEGHGEPAPMYGRPPWRKRPCQSIWLFYFWLCYRKWLMLFSLKRQRDNRKKALTVHPATGKTGKKALFFHRTVEMKQLHALTEPYFCIMLKIEPFSPIFPLMAPWLGRFIRYSFRI